MYRFNVIPVKIAVGFVVEIDKPFLTCIQKSEVQRTYNSSKTKNLKTNLED